MILVNLFSSFIRDGLRLNKILAFGRNDVREAHQTSPFGDDANPPEGMQAIYSKTSNLAEPVILGYINKENIAGPGEKRIFSVDENGEVSSFVFLKNNGDILFNGEGDNLVKFIDLETALKGLTDDLQDELTKIQAGIVGAGGTYTPGQLSINIDDAKAEDLKTKLVP